jgi:phosphatidylserine decarboxylase
LARRGERRAFFLISVFRRFLVKYKNCRIDQVDSSDVLVSLRSGLVFMVKEGFPFIIVPVVLALIAGYFQLWLFAALFVVLAGFMAYFFRDPNRVTPEGDGLIISAADGKVTRIDTNDAGKIVSVFLSPLDVHINRSPITGKIIDTEYIKGKKGPATTNNASFVNERNSLTIQNERMTVVCTQIAGIVARRIVCWKKTGDELKRGERFGLIKFSSRTDLLMPHDAEIKVRIGDRVRGGETVIAALPEI